MSAVVGVLTESLTEAIKSFYKLRRAYQTLESIMDAEKKYLKERSTSSLASAGSSRPASTASTKDASQVSVNKPSTPEKPSAAPSTTSLSGEPKIEEAGKNNGKIPAIRTDDDFDFVDADEAHPDIATPQEYMGHINVPTEQGASIDLDNSRKEVHIKSSSAPNLPSNPTPTTSVPDAVEDFSKLTLQDTIRQEDDISIYGKHPVDTFIISGANFCFGILLLMVALVPPAFATLLRIVGFRGDRDRGVTMLWQATKFHNIHGAMAGLVLFGYYNVIVGFCDIIPSTREGIYPKARCQALLAEMRRRHPDSHLWLLEEARMMASERQLEKSIAFMADAPPSKLKQLEALNWFERSLSYMYIHEYEEASVAFQKCVTLNNWSHGLYFYIVGASHVELYRRVKTSDPTEAAKQKAKAKEFFDKVMPNTGKKKFMQRQLPFDVFVSRKIQKWEARAKEWGCDMIDAVGVSPLEEMNYFWNGYKRMRNEHLEVSLQNLAWSESDQNPYFDKEGLDEKAILAVLRAATLRNMGQTAKSKEILQTEIIAHDKTLFNGHLKDNWTAPCARYEMAGNLWREADAEGKPEDHKDILDQCKTWLQEVSSWGSFDLDAR